MPKVFRVRIAVESTEDEGKTWTREAEMEPGITLSDSLDQEATKSFASALDDAAVDDVMEHSLPDQCALDGTPSEEDTEEEDEI